MQNIEFCDGDQTLQKKEGLGRGRKDHNVSYSPPATSTPSAAQFNFQGVRRQDLRPLPCKPKLSLSPSLPLCRFFCLCLPPSLTLHSLSPSGLLSLVSL